MFDLSTRIACALIATPALVHAQDMPAMGSSHGFLENRGQYPEAVRYLARTADCSLAVRDEGWTLIERGRHPISGKPASMAIGFELFGAPVEPWVESGPETGTTHSYLSAGKAASITDLQASGEVLLGDPEYGASIRFYETAGSFQYDVQLDELERLETLRIQVHGAGALEVVDGGRALRILAGEGEVLQHIPLAWQVGEDGEQFPIDVDYVVDPGTTSYGFRVNDGIEGLATVIDPILYSTLLGGGNWDRVHGIDRTSDRITFVGNTAEDFPRPPGNPDPAVNFPVTPGALQSTHRGSSFPQNVGWNWPLTDDHEIDIFVGQIDPVGGQLMYSTFFGASGNEYVTCVHVDEGSGIISFGGHVESELFNNYDSAFHISWGNTFQSNYVGGPTVGVTLQVMPLIRRWLCVNGGFVAQLDPAQTGNAQLEFSSFYTGSGNDRVQAVYYDGQNRLYFGGRSTSTDLPMAVQQGDVPAPYQSTLSNPGPQNAFSNTDAFLACFLIPQSGPATLDFSTFFGGDDFDQISSIRVASSNRVIVGGTTASQNMPVVQQLWAYNQSSTTNTNFRAADAFVAVFRPRGSGAPGNWSMTLDFSTYVGGADGDILEDMDWDPATDEVLFVGNTWSTQPLGAYPTTLKAVQINPPSIGRNCAFTSNGVSQFMPYMHGFATRIKLGSAWTQSPPSLRFSTFLGGASGDTLVTFLHLLENQGFYVGGTTWATDFPIPDLGEDNEFGTNNNIGQGVDSTCYGDNAADGFVVRLDRDAYYILQGTFLGAAQDDYIWTGDGDGKGRISVGGMTLNSGFAYTRNGQGYANGITPRPDEVFPTTANAVSSSYTYPQYMVRRRFGDASVTPIPLSTAPRLPMNPLGNYFESGIYNAGEAFVSELELQCANVTRVFEGTEVPTCLGEPIIDVLLNPETGTQHFGFTCENAPPGASPPPSDGSALTPPAPFDNVSILLDLNTTALATVYADAYGSAEYNLSLVGAGAGATVTGQFLWITPPSGCPSTPAGPWSSTSGLTITTY